MDAMDAIGYALVALLLGGGALTAYLRRWAARERVLSSPSEMVTLKAMLARGISDAPGLFSQGHAKAVPQLSALGAQCALVIAYAHETDTSATATAYFRVEPAKSALLQSAYASYFPGGELSFFETEPGEDPFALAHAGLVAGARRSEADRLRLWLLGQLQRVRLA